MDNKENVDIIVLNGVRVPYTITKMKRKSLSMKMNREGILDVRVPKRVSKKYTMDFVTKNSEFVIEVYKNWKSQKENRITYTPTEEYKYREEARRRCSVKATEYAKNLGVAYNQIRIKDQHTRWGSCSTKHNLNFNWRLVLMPEYILDYVVAHEVAHLIEMNHSAKFWKVVETLYPDWQEARAWLKSNGQKYM